SGTDYTVNVTTKTVIVRKYFGTSNLEEFMVGDTLEIVSTPTTTTYTVDATRIRDVSIQRKNGTFRGKIGTLTCSQNTFLFTPEKRAQQTVYLSSKTVIIRRGEKITCTDLKGGETAVVIGIWRSATKRIDADRVIVKSSTITGRIQSITLTDGGLPAVVTIERGNAVSTSAKKTTAAKNSKLWTINVDASTHLLLKKLSTGTLSQFKVGNMVQAVGVVRPVRTLDAIVLRNLSRSTVVLRSGKTIVPAALYTVKF
ncbi:MAG: hypothetical protein V1778_02465, partial [bacterium]